MAVEYANILRTLNMMMESRARREDAKTEASLRALQMAQQEERFNKELAFKKEQFGLQEKQYMSQMEDKFLSRAGNLAKISLENWGSEASTVWKDTFSGWYNSFLAKDEVAVIKNQKKAIESLTGNGDYVFTDAVGAAITMTKAQAEDLLTQMSVINQSIAAGSDVTKDLDAFFTKYEEAAGVKLTAYDEGRSFRDGYKRLTDEILETERGNFTFDMYKSLDPSLATPLPGDNDSNILTPDDNTEVQDLTLDVVLNTLDFETMSQFINLDGNEANILARKQSIVKGIPGLNNWGEAIDNMQLPYDADNNLKIQNFNKQEAIIRVEKFKTKKALKELNIEISNNLKEHNNYIDYHKSTGQDYDMTDDRLYDAEEQNQHNLEKLILETQLEVMENKANELQPQKRKLLRGW